MGTGKLASTELRNTLFRLRDSRGWSMAAMAELLNAKGLKTYPTTIAKIEAGDRTVQVDELVAYAEIFDVSTDLLLGHTSTGAGDKTAQVGKLLEQMKRAMWAIQSTEVALTDAANDLVGHELTPAENTLCVGAGMVCEALALAATTLERATKPVVAQELEKRDGRK